MTQEIFFKSPEHKQRFLEAMQENGKVEANGIIDAEYGAAFYILTESPSTWNRTKSYISRHAINFEDILQEVDFGGAYSTLIRLASNLFNGNEHIGPVEFINRLDDDNMKIAMSAMTMRRYRMRLDDFR